MKILVVTGQSGGHIFPALAFLEALKEKYSNIDALLVLPEKNIIRERQILSNEVKYVNMPSIELSINSKNIGSILKLFKGVWESLSILIGFSPDIVVGFGSLLSVPVIMFSWLLRIRTLVHEQNVLPGRANRLLAHFADKIAVSFQETSRYLTCQRGKIVVTGNPLRKALVAVDKLKALDFFGLNPAKFTILVMGGSQGSRRINQEFLNAVSLMEDKSVFQIIHLCGSADYELLKDKYKTLDIKVALFSFFVPMHYAYSASDLAVSRAGATAIAELMFFRLPAIFIPYPYAGCHQYENARVVKERGCGFIIKDDELNAARLKENLESLLYNRDRLKNMAAAYAEFSSFPAADLLADEAAPFN